MIWIMVDEMSWTVKKEEQRIISLKSIGKKISYKSINIF